jgi:haloalkane dehalogenase
MALHPSIVTDAVKCFNSNIHYYHTPGVGDPIVFLHGMPTSGYVWRKIMPSFTGKAPTYAPDLIGCGLSDKPDIKYNFDDYIRYFSSWVEKLKLKNIHLVVHGWGSIVGFHYASINATNIKSIAFYESHVRPLIHWDLLPLPMQQLSYLISDPKNLKKKVLEDNFLIEQLLNDCRTTTLSEDDINTYRQPYRTIKSRMQLLTYLQHLPLGNKCSPCLGIIKAYSNFLQNWDKPKCMLYSLPGFNTSIDTVQWCKTNLPNLTLKKIPKSMHFAQETQHELFAKHLEAWLASQYLTKKQKE